MIAFVPEKPAPRKCKIGCQSPFPRVGYIRREKLFKYGKYGRPGVKTEYNEKFRDWNCASSKYDNVSVSMYSQNMLNRVKNALPMDGYPCVCFTGTFDGKTVEKLQPYDPYADEWFDNQELHRTLKAQPVALCERPKEQKVSPAVRAYQHHSDTEIERSQSMHSKMAFIRDHIGRKGSNHYLRTVASSETISTAVHPPKKREAWCCDSAGSIQENRATKKVTRRNSCDLDEDSAELTRIRDLQQMINNVDQKKIKQHKLNAAQMEVKQHKELDQSAVQSVSSTPSVQRVRSEALISQQTSLPPTPPRTPKKPRPATSATPRKKYNLKGRPDQKNKMIYNNLSPQDKNFLNDMYDGLLELQNRSPKKDEEDIKAEENRLYDEARRANEYPYNCAAHKEMINNYLKDYRYWQAVDFEKPPECAPGVHEKQVPLLRARELAFAEARKGKKPETKPATPPKKEKSSCRNQCETMQPQSPPEKIHFQENIAQNADIPNDNVGENFTKLIQDRNQILERDHKKRMSDQGKVTAYDSSYKNWQVKGKPKTPIWAEKTYKSLGTGFWDLPFNKDEGWKKRERLKAAREKSSYQAEADKRKELHEAHSKARDPFITTYYPEFRTSTSYLTQYLREFHRMPLPQRQEA